MRKFLSFDDDEEDDDEYTLVLFSVGKAYEHGELTP